MFTTSVAISSSIGQASLYRQAITSSQIQTSAQSDTSIIGGETAEDGAWPWVVAIIQDNGGNAFWSQFCGGTLISPEWVLTAAHCTYYISGMPIEPHELAVVAGRQQLSSDAGEQLSVVQIVRHPLYDGVQADYDVALLRLASPSIQPVVKMITPAELDLEAEDTPAVVIGWGRTSDKARIDRLQQVDVPLVSTEVCKNAYKLFGYVVTDRMICAGLAGGGKDACSGDSGGPLVVQKTSAENPEETEWVEVGIVSWGRGCALPDSYGVYTRISEVYGWVAQQVGLDADNSPDGTVILPDPTLPGEEDEDDRPKGKSAYSLFLPVVAR